MIFCYPWLAPSWKGVVIVEIGIVGELWLLLSADEFSWGIFGRGFFSVSWSWDLELDLLNLWSSTCNKIKIANINSAEMRWNVTMKTTNILGFLYHEKMKCESWPNSRVATFHFFYHYHDDYVSILYLNYLNNVYTSHLTVLALTEMNWVMKILDDLKKDLEEVSEGYDLDALMESLYD